MLSLTQLASLTLVLVVIWYARKLGSREPGLPPGPPTLPVIGNVHQFSKDFLPFHLTDWSKRYGGMFSLKLVSQTVIVITSPRIVRDFMDKRSSSVSERPQLKMVDMITDGHNMAFSGSGPTWRMQRKAIHTFLSRPACARHIPIQEAEATQFLYELLEDPKNFFSHAERQFASIMMSTVFGIRCPQSANSLASVFFKLQHDFEKALEPGTYPPIDFIPILDYVPERFASWKKAAKDLREKQRTYYSKLLGTCERRMKENRRNGCFIEDVLDDQVNSGLTRDMVAYLGGVSLEGGASTTATFLHRFILCISRHPQVQARAQKDVDAVIGQDRMPQMDDITQLPFVEAIIKEVHRFYTTSALALPHATSADEYVDGYFIPKGSIVFMNIFGIYHSEDLYDEPLVFRPERYLESEFGTKSNASTAGLRHDLHFGSGRRICPGNHLANNAIIMNVLNILWGFNLSSDGGTRRGSGAPITQEDFTSSMSPGPKPFACNIVPRSDRCSALIRKAFTEAKPIFRLFEQDLAHEDLVSIDLNL